MTKWNAISTARIAITLTGKEWAALCGQFVLNESLSTESDEIAALAKLKVLQQVYNAAKALGPEPAPTPVKRKRRAIIITALVLAVLLIGARVAAANGNGQPPPGPPPPPNGGLVTHNGSVMRVEPLIDGRVLIRYVAPRPEMLPFVVPGTVLVEGRWIAPGVFSGVSHSYWCGRAYPYAVTGGIEPATGGLLLQGPAPIIDPYTCGVLWYEWTGNSTLRFEPYGGPR